ncbi:MAG: EAL domain-containing protein [Acidimicrobiia bacterium]|nr:EAL domain-containing protein [Acidimicrobiia bacterium]
MRDSAPPISGRVAGTLAAVPFVAFYGGPVVGPLVAVALVMIAIALVVATKNVPPRRITDVHLWYGLLVEIFCVIGLPNLWAAFCLAAASTITAGVFGTRSRSGLLVGIGGGVVMSAVGWYHDVDHWLAVSFALLLVPLIAFTTSQILDVLRGYEDTALEELTRSSQAIIWEADATTAEMRTVAGSVRTLTGYHPADWARLNWDELVHPDDREGFRSFAVDVVDAVNTVGSDHRSAAGHPPRGRWEGRISTADGSWIYVRETFQIHTAEDGLPVARGITLDIDELHAANQLAIHKATHDELTGLPNRVLLTDLATGMLAGRRNDHVALILVDVNRFTEVNETLGHAIGDRYLVALARRFAALRKDGVEVARVGSDEFAFVAAGCASADDAVALTERILGLCSEEVALTDTSLRLGATAGIAVSKPEETDIVDMNRRVDSALNTAKKRKKPWHIAGIEDLDKARRRLSLAAQVPVAIQTGQLELWYQPKHNLASGAVIGFEGLIRWRHPEHGILSPFEFLDIIELSGQSQAFDRHVVESAIRFAADCRRVAPKSRIAVNVPGRALRSGGIVDVVMENLAMWDLPASNLVVELTEDAISEDLETVVPALQHLADLGCHISIDDFGTGDSSLIRLRRFPVGELKIDRSFVSGITTSPSDAAIVEWTLELAQAMGLNCVAEGIEKPEELAYLIEHGCPEGQGYLFSKPVPPDEAFDYLVKSMGENASAGDSVGASVESQDLDRADRST